RSFEVSEATINAWKREHVEFARALKDGKRVADARVVRSLFHRAIGYEHEAVKVYLDVRTRKPIVVPYTKRYPPETSAAIFWLKNRRPDLWRDRQNVAMGRASFADRLRLARERLEQLERDRSLEQVGADASEESR